MFKKTLQALLSGDTATAKEAFTGVVAKAIVGAEKLAQQAEVIVTQVEGELTKLGTKANEKLKEFEAAVEQSRKPAAAAPADEAPQAPEAPAAEEQAPAEAAPKAAAPKKARTRAPRKKA